MNHQVSCQIHPLHKIQCSINFEGHKVAWVTWSPGPVFIPTHFMQLFAYLEHLCLLEGLPTRKIHPVEEIGQCNLNIQIISCHMFINCRYEKINLLYTKCTHAYYKNYLLFCMYHTRFVSSIILQNFVVYMSKARL